MPNLRPETSTSPSPSSSPSSEPSPSAQPSAVPSQPSGTDDSAGGAATGWVIAALLVVILLASPSLIRIALRRWRLQPGSSAHSTATRAWREVEATFTDLGMNWSYKSPGPAADDLAADLPAAAGETLQEIGHRAELVYYAAQDAAADDLPTLVSELRQELLREAPSSKRFIAILAPRSLLPGG